jgi:transcriptional regulator with XRE-family HTH domain
VAQKGWKATGLLQPRWKGYEGGREGLAAAVGTSPTSLSNVNSGKRNLGHDLGQRLAAALKISVLELGAPAAAAAPEDQPFLDRLAEAEALLNRLSPEIENLAGEIDALALRVATLEKPARSRKPRAGNKR